MNTRWILAAFAGGVAVGVVATRVVMDRPAEPVANAAEVSEPNARTPTPPVTVAAADHAPTRAASKPGGEAKPLSSLAAPVSASTDPVPATTDDGFVQHIDVGPAFAESIGRPSQPGFENQMGDAHRALEREVRNDGWAYTTEGEIQNSMVNEVSTGEFNVDHIECRATMCEVRLSGTAKQADAVKRWQETVGQHSFGQRLSMNYSSMTANDEHMDMLMILRKPPPMPPRPN